MGGEPTFCRDRTIPTAPSGNNRRARPGKRRLSGELFDKLQARFAPGGLRHHGQGKWYPGEPLPRWALTCYFRKDGTPIWRRAELAAKDPKPGQKVPVGAWRTACWLQAITYRSGMSPAPELPAARVTSREADLTATAGLFTP